ncbi:LPXTG cell wall anchor domain-containing protein [Lysinibacillus sp. NPDC095746]
MYDFFVVSLAILLLGIIGVVLFKRRKKKGRA